MKVLVLNSGSSSIKYQVIDMPAERTLTSGTVAAIGPGAEVESHAQGLEEIFARLSADGVVPDAIGHRVVHGGPAFAAPALVDDAVYAAIRDQVSLAPLHNPANLAGIEAARGRMPGVPQVAVFDTAFHQSMPEQAAAYPLPAELCRQHGIRRYGFHGTNCAWCLAAAAAHLGRPAATLNLIVAHLGAGASVTAINSGRSVDTSMGLSPLEGLMMQTRCGDLDPAIPLRLVRSGMSADEVDQLLNFESGVKAVCGEADMRAVAQRASGGDEAALLARQMYARRVARYVGAYAGLAWPLDALVFTGGVGENDASMRQDICAALPQLRVGLVVLVIAANEELQIARETVACIAAAHAAG